MAGFWMFVIGFFAGAIGGVVVMAFLVMARQAGQREPKPSPGFGRGFAPMDAPSRS